MASLLQISLLIRQPGYERKYLHSTGTTNTSSTVARFADCDLIHVAEKLRSWRQTRKILDSEEASRAVESLGGMEGLEDFPHTQAALVQRLAKANTRRREQLRYWVKYPDKANDLTGEIMIGIHTGVAGLTRNKPDVGSEILNPKAIALQSIDMIDGPYRMSESIKTRDTFSTRIESDVYGRLTASRISQVQYEKSIMGNKRTNQVPRIPRIATEATSFECPCCHGRISVSRMRRREEWK
jgi:hypothetical protein